MFRVHILLFCIIAINIFISTNDNVGFKVLALTKLPMQNWVYNATSSDYYNDLEKDVAHDVKHLNFGAKDFKFREFPVKYWIEPTNNTHRAQIERAISEFSKHFSMVEVLNKNNADLTIETINYNEACKLLNTKKVEAYALGGMETSRKIDKNGMVISRKIKSNIYLLPKTFDNIQTKKIILHELCHAFGIKVHSNNPRDVMYPRYSPECNNCLSESDLNTLWRLYNQKVTSKL